MCLKKIDAELGAVVLLIAMPFDLFFTPLVIHSIGEAFCSWH